MYNSIHGLNLSFLGLRKGRRVTAAIAALRAHINTESRERNFTSGELRLQSAAPIKTIMPPDNLNLDILFQVFPLLFLVVEKCEYVREGLEASSQYSVYLGDGNAVICHGDLSVVSTSAAEEHLSFGQHTSAAMEYQRIV